MEPEFTDADLESYLDETLHPELAAELEQVLKSNRKLLARLSAINGRRDAGVHTLGEIWRRNQISVPTTDQISKYLAGRLTQQESEYIDFRIHTLKCRYTIAKVRDMESHSGAQDDSGTDDRRRKFFDSSAKLLRKKKN